MRDDGVVHLDDVPRGWLLAAAAVFAGYALWAYAQGVWRRARMRRRFARAAEGERTAGPLLEDAGFTIEGAQVTAGYSLRLDGRPIPIQLRADYLVSRGNARYVAEVKTGKEAPKVENRATRRQLLEYQHAFEVDGVLLVDAEAGRIHRVDFARRTGRKAWPTWAVVATVLSFGTILGIRELLSVAFERFGR